MIVRVVVGNTEPDRDLIEELDLIRAEPVLVEIIATEKDHLIVTLFHFALWQDRAVGATVGICLCLRNLFVTVA